MKTVDLLSKVLCFVVLCSPVFADQTFPPSGRTLDLKITKAPVDTVCSVANARGKVKVRHGQRIRIKINGYPGTANIMCKMPGGQTITLMTNKFLFKRSTHKLVTEGDVSSVVYSVSFPSGTGSATTVTKFGTFGFIVVEDAIRNYSLSQR